ncbi:MAG: CDP-alcohol phosphatidyltransferase family protein [Planctomycetes bacterium]|nr:CDP-alcohol phosphatidyltransferase family protein [Planctomycetota bacterium]
MAFAGKLRKNDTKRKKRRRLKSMSLFPTLLTIGNLLCGFAAIHFALRAMYDLGAGIPDDAVQTFRHAAWERMLPSYLTIGAGLIILGMVFDCFDGLVARATRSTTNFGGQLDSLADVITCGAAPAALMIVLMTRELAGDAIIPSPFSEHAWGRFTWIAAAVYVALAAVRLARFNVEHADTDSDHESFRGLPSPGAAAVIAALIIVREQFNPLGRQIIAYALPVVALCTAFLMVSRIPYRRFYRAYLLGRKPFSRLVGILLVLVIFWSYKAPTLLVLVLWYAGSGPAEAIYRRMRPKRPIASSLSCDTAQADRLSG